MVGLVAKNDQTQNTAGEVPVSGWWSRVSLFVSAALYLLCGVAGISRAADVLTLFDRDPVAVLVLSTVPKPTSFFILMLDRGGPSETKHFIAEINNTPRFFYEKPFPLERLKLLSLERLKGQIPKDIRKGVLVLVRGRDEYIQLFGKTPRNWPSITVVRSNVDLIPAAPAVQPNRAVSWTDFHHARKSYRAAAGKCTAGQSTLEPPMPKTRDEFERVELAAKNGDPDAQ
jgi:hypothetical protein